MLLRVLLIQMMSTTPWRTFVLVVMLPSPGTCRRSSMPRLLVLFLVRPGLFLDLELSLVVALGLLRRPVLLHSLELPLAVVIPLLTHLVVPVPGRRALLPRDRRGRGLRGFPTLQAPFPRISSRRDSDILPEGYPTMLSCHCRDI
jgi:hypothetical protein